MQRLIQMGVPVTDIREVAEAEDIYHKINDKDEPSNDKIINTRMKIAKDPQQAPAWLDDNQSMMGMNTTFTSGFGAGGFGQTRRDSFDTSIVGSKAGDRAPSQQDLMRQSTRQFFNDAYSRSNAFASGVFNDYKAQADAERLTEENNDDEVEMGAGPLSRLRRNKRKKHDKDNGFSDVKVDMNAGIMDLLEDFSRFAQPHEMLEPAFDMPDLDDLDTAPRVQRSASKVKIRKMILRTGSAASRASNQSVPRKQSVERSIDDFEADDVKIQSQ